MAEHTPCSSTPVAFALSSYILLYESVCVALCDLFMPDASNNDVEICPSVRPAIESERGGATGYQHVSLAIK